MNRKLIAIAALIMTLPLGVQADAIADLEAEYKANGAGNFSTAAGEALWNKEFVNAKSGDKRKCTTCHTTDLKQAGKHAKTGKTIEPMAPSINSKRFTDIKKINKWFKRNCKWTLGRECTAQEKGDILAFIKSL
ncbi:DUF1924 domain-containing protein [Pseudomonadota bacterium]